MTRRRKQLTPAIRSAFRFFLHHAGYATPPGRVACALALAKAEAKLLASDLEFITRDDDERAYCYCDNPTCKYHEGSKHDWPTIAAAIVRPCTEHGLDCKHAEYLASLGGIMEPDANYLRVIRAELACEVFPNAK